MSTEFFSLQGFIEKQLLFSVLPVDVVPVVVDHVSDAFATESYTLSPRPISVPVPKQFGSASGRGLETQRTVSDHAMLMLVVTNYLALVHVFGYQYY